MTELAFVGIDNKWVVEPGDFKISVEKLSTDFEVFDKANHLGSKISSLKGDYYPFTSIRVFSIIFLLWYNLLKMFNMYKLIPILVLLIFSPLLATSQQLYDDFEATANVGYGFINGVYERNLSNPDTTGLNTSLTCAKYTRNIAVPYDVILIEPSDFMNDLSDYLSGNKTMSMYVKTDVSVTVQITLENKTDAQPSNYPTGGHSVYLDTTSGSGEWEKLTFKFDSSPIQLYLI